jgi:tRNA threonylcarbamoyladenosine modification (KEOPS) complex Cgi121 subunit
MPILASWGFSSMNSTPDDEFNALAAEAEIEWPEITRQLAALFQIHGAIKLFHKGEIECSITLAGAAEGILPDDLENFSLYKICENAKRRNQKSWI